MVGDNRSFPAWRTAPSPYHQVIGFYLERAGYSASDLDHFRRKPLDIDFYLDYQITDPVYSRDWRLYYPRDLHRRDLHRPAP